MIALLAAHAVAAVVAPALVRWWGRRAFVVLAAPPAAAAVWGAARTSMVAAGDVYLERVTWVPSLNLTLAFRVDTLAWLMVLIVGGVGALVVFYCAWYFDDSEPGLGRFAGCLVGFAGAMLGLVASDDMLVLYVFWELTTVLSYLLIGHRTISRESRSAATTALIVTTAGGLAMLAGIVLLGERAGSYRLSAVVDAGLGGTLVTTAVVLVLVGAVSKSALVPFHFWLPAAMAAPTPVSAYLHAAAMVKAGVYLIARLAPGFADLPLWRPVLLGLGGLTMLIGGWRALRQHDLKLLLAYGTVAQLGFLTILLGAGSRNAALAGLTLLLAHAMFKAALFLTVGIVDRAAGTRDLRELSGLGRRAPVLAVAAVLAAASMAGLPPMLGFVAKETAFAAFADGGTDTPILVVLVGGSTLTVAYSARFLWGAFGTRPARPATEIQPPGAGSLSAPVLLAVGGVAAGIGSTALEPLTQPYISAWQPDRYVAHLGLWHGLTTALLLSLLTLTAGLALFAARARVEALQAHIPDVADAGRFFQRLLRLTDRASLESTAAIQRGSLPVSLGAVIVMLIILPGGALLLGAVWPAEVDPGSPAQLAVALIIAIAAVAAAVSPRRLSAAILVGITGYGVAALFLLHGAPDLALTQILVETVSLVLFVLVLRRLPSRFWDTSAGSGVWIRGALGVGVGLAVSGMTLTASSVRTADPASVGMTEAAYQFGGGRNVVNVILVDIRAWDTMGELSVVLAAATGVASLIFLRERSFARVAEAVRTARSQRSRQPSAAADGPRWLARLPIPSGRSVIFEVVTRLTFHTVILYSLYLLFSGHNNPGGGFAAGLVAGLGLTVRYLAGGRAELRAAVPIMPGLLLGSGLFLASGVGIGAMLLGGNVLQSWIVEVDLPLLGHVKLVTSLFFDIGVYLVVVGLMLDILRSLGSALDVQIEEARQAEGDPR